MKKAIPRIAEVKALPQNKLFVSFYDGVNGIIDLSDDKDKGVFKIWNQPDIFNNVFISDHGSIAWNEEVEIDSLNIYLTLTNQTYDFYARS